MRKRSPFAMACLFALALAACSGITAETTTSPAASTEATQETATPLASAAPTPSPAQTPSPSPEVETAIVPKYRMNEVYRFVPINEETEKKAVLLTFDDGPKEEALIASIMDTLDKHNAKAIFFVNGYRVKANPELLQLIHERGGTIGNHSYDHINLKNESPETVEAQIGDVQKLVEELVGEQPRFFRPPFGAGGDNVKEIAKNHGMLFMTWSNGSLDWDASAKNKPEVVIANVMEQLHPGANILMHELQWTADALDELLTKIEDAGYLFIDPAEIELTD